MKKKAFCFTLVFVFFGVALCRGYILPAEQILELMVDQLGSSRTLVVLQKTVLYDSDLEGGMKALDERLYFKFPDRFRAEVGDPGVEQIRVFNDNDALVILDGRVTSDREDEFDRFKDVFLLKDSEKLGEQLSSAGIDLDVVSLGRYKGSISYIIGAKYPDKGVPQLWVDKASFRPIRLLLDDTIGPNDALKGIEYTEWQEEEGTAYPGRILFLEGGTLVRMHVTTTFLKNQEIPDEKFHMEGLRRSYGPDLHELSEEALPSSELEDVKKRIEDFGRSFE